MLKGTTMGKYHNWSGNESDVRVIAGNNKLGKVPNLSLLPGVTCAKDAPCNCKGCYAKKFLYPSVKKAWGFNTRLAAKPADFFANLRKQFEGREVKWFRFMVSGDIPSYSFFCHLMRFVADFPNTKFLLFTKRYSWVNRWLNHHIKTKNIAVILSAWPGYELKNPHGLPVAWMRDGTDNRIPSNAIECPGGCEDCGMCWNLPNLGRDVVFDKH
jgi:hypothetical protein